MNEYLITMNRKTLETYQSARDKELGYPEIDAQLIEVGPGRHVPKDLCRAWHYDAIITDKTETQFAIRAIEEKEVPVDCECKPLPIDWYDTMVRSK